MGEKELLWLIAKSIFSPKLEDLNPNWCLERKSLESNQAYLLIINTELIQKHSTIIINEINSLYPHLDSNLLPFK